MEKKSCDDGAEAFAGKAREGGRVGSGAEAGEEHAADAAEDADVADWGFVGGKERGRRREKRRKEWWGVSRLRLSFFGVE